MTCSSVMDGNWKETCPLSEDREEWMLLLQWRVKWVGIGPGLVNAELLYSAPAINNQESIAPFTYHLLIALM